jgi:hypothetical protein
MQQQLETEQQEASAANNDPESPRSKVFISQELETDRLYLKRRIEYLEQEIQSKGDKSAAESDDIQLKHLQTELLRLSNLHTHLSVEYEKHKKDAEQSAQEITKQQQIEMAQHLKSMKRIIIEADLQSTNKKRAIRPVSTYADLVSQIECMFPACKLVSLDTAAGFQIGSQDELIFAYEDCIKEGNFSLAIRAQFRKKAIQSEMILETEPAVSNSPVRRKQIKHVGKWEFSEILLYQQAVKLFGEKKWQRIAEYVGTRDEKQVKNFAETHLAKRFVIAQTDLSRFSFQETYSEAIRGLSTAVDGVREIHQDE